MAGHTMISLLILCLSLFSVPTWAGNSDWLSPVYNYFFQYPLPIPPDKPYKHLWKNATTGKVIKYYEVEIKAFEQQGQDFDDRRAGAWC